MVVLRTVEAMRAWRRARGGRLAAVPTMGALHAGHARLMEEARKHADGVAVSIFVNPTQFGPNEDFTKYPRDEAGDLRVCENAGVDAVFIPTADEMYAPGASVFVDETKLSAGLCGARRPGHFQGVCTVVLKLMNIMGAEAHLYGEKDFQQLAVIRRMVRDLDVDVEIVGVPIVREADGLAMSSRNCYLSAREREDALGLWQALRLATEAAQNGEWCAETLRGEMRRCMKAYGLRVDYAEVVDGETLEPLAMLKQNSRALVAAWCGSTRLIDNAGLHGN